MDAVQVAPNLYIGGWSAARDVQWDRIICCAADSPAVFTQDVFGLVDGPGNDPAVVLGAVRCVESAIRSGRKTLVHCVAGYSRSLTVAARALSITSGRAYEDVLSEFKRKRGCTPKRPNCPHEAMAEAARCVPSA